jgi:hypothetical protein
MTLGDTNWGSTVFGTMDTIIRNTLGEFLFSCFDSFLPFLFSIFLFLSFPLLGLLVKKKGEFSSAKMISNLIDSK